MVDKVNTDDMAHKEDRMANTVNPYEMLKMSHLISIFDVFVFSA